MGSLFASLLLTCAIILPLLFYFTVLSIGLIRSYTLKKYEIGQDWTTILENIISFERSGKFLYASVLTDPKDIVSIPVMVTSPWPDISR